MHQVHILIIVFKNPYWQIRIQLNQNASHWNRGDSETNRCWKRQRKKKSGENRRIFWLVSTLQLDCFLLVNISNKLPSFLQPPNVKDLFLTEGDENPTWRHGSVFCMCLVRDPGLMFGPVFIFVFLLFGSRNLLDQLGVFVFVTETKTLRIFRVCRRRHCAQRSLWRAQRDYPLSLSSAKLFLVD